MDSQRGRGAGGPASNGATSGGGFQNSSAGKSSRRRRRRRRKKAGKNVGPKRIENFADFLGTHLVKRQVPPASESLRHTVVDAFIGPELKDDFAQSLCDSVSSKGANMEPVVDVGLLPDYVDNPRGPAGILKMDLEDGTFFVTLCSAEPFVVYTAMVEESPAPSAEGVLDVAEDDLLSRVDRAMSEKSRTSSSSSSGRGSVGPSSEAFLHAQQCSSSATQDEDSAGAPRGSGTDETETSGVPDSSTLLPHAIVGSPDESPKLESHDDAAITTKDERAGDEAHDTHDGSNEEKEDEENEDHDAPRAAKPPMLSSLRESPLVDSDEAFYGSPARLPSADQRPSSDHPPEPSGPPPTTTKPPQTVDMKKAMGKGATSVMMYFSVLKSGSRPSDGKDRSTTPSNGRDRSTTPSSTTKKKDPSNSSSKRATSASSFNFLLFHGVIRGASLVISPVPNSKGANRPPCDDQVLLEDGGAPRRDTPSSLDGSGVKEGVFSCYVSQAKECSGVLEGTFSFYTSSNDTHEQPVTIRDVHEPETGAAVETHEGMFSFYLAPPRGVVAEGVFSNYLVPPSDEQVGAVDVVEGTFSRYVVEEPRASLERDEENEHDASDDMRLLEGTFSRYVCPVEIVEGVFSMYPRVMIGGAPSSPPPPLVASDEEPPALPSTDDASSSDSEEQCELEEEHEEESCGAALVERTITPIPIPGQIPIQLVQVSSVGRIPVVEESVYTALMPNVLVDDEGWCSADGDAQKHRPHHQQQLFAIPMDGAAHSLKQGIVEVEVTGPGVLPVRMEGGREGDYLVCDTMKGVEPGKYTLDLVRDGKPSNSPVCVALIPPGHSDDEKPLFTLRLPTLDQEDLPHLQVLLAGPSVGRMRAEFNARLDAVVLHMHGFESAGAFRLRCRLRGTSVLDSVFALVAVDCAEEPLLRLPLFTGDGEAVRSTRGLEVAISGPASLNAKIERDDGCVVLVVTSVEDSGEFTFALTKHGEPLRDCPMVVDLVQRDDGGQAPAALDPSSPSSGGVDLAATLYVLTTSKSDSSAAAAVPSSHAGAAVPARPETPASLGPISFVLDASLEEDAPLSVVVLGPDWEEVSCEVERKPRAPPSVHFVPVEPGAYRVSVSTRPADPKAPQEDIPLEGSPFVLMVAPDGSTSVSKTRPTLLQIPLSRLNGEPLSLADGVNVYFTGPAAVEAELVDTRDGLALAVYHVGMMGEYVICVKVGGEHVADSPMVVDFSSMPGGGEQSPRCDSDSPAVILCHPLGAAGPPPEGAEERSAWLGRLGVRTKGPGAVGARFRIVDVADEGSCAPGGDDQMLDGDLLPLAVLEVLSVSRPGAYTLRVVRDGDEAAVVDTVNLDVEQDVADGSSAPLVNFVLRTITPDGAAVGEGGRLSVRVTAPGESGKEVPHTLGGGAAHSADSRCVMFRASQAGTYRVEVSVDGTPLVGSPFAVDVENAVAPPMDSKEVPGGVVEEGSIADDDIAEGKVLLQLPLEEADGSPVRADAASGIEVEVSGPATLRARLVPMETGTLTLVLEDTQGGANPTNGEYTIMVHRGGAPLRGFPSIIGVSKTDQGDAGGSIPRVAFSVCPTDDSGNLVVDRTDQVQASAVNPHGQRVSADVSQTSPGKYTVSFIPTGAGLHMVDVSFAGEPLEGSPFRVDVGGLDDDAAAAQRDTEQPKQLSAAPKEGKKKTKKKAKKKTKKKSIKRKRSATTAKGKKSKEKLAAAPEDAADTKKDKSATTATSKKRKGSKKGSASVGGGGDDGASKGSKARDEEEPSGDGDKKGKKKKAKKKKAKKKKKTKSIDDDPANGGGKSSAKKKAEKAPKRKKSAGSRRATVAATGSGTHLKGSVSLLPNEKQKSAEESPRVSKTKSKRKKREKFGSLPRKKSMGVDKSGRPATDRG